VKGGRDVSGKASLLCGETGVLTVRALLRPVEAQSDVARFISLASIANLKYEFDDEWLLAAQAC